jgi:hypothetical protein
MNSGSSSAFSEYQIDTTEGYVSEPLVTSRPKVIEFAGTLVERTMNTSKANIPILVLIN